MGFSAPRGRNAVSGWCLPEKAEGWEATVVTEHASGCVGEIHHRTPLILSGENLRQWLYDETQARQFLEEAKERVLLKRKKMEGETL